MEVYKEILEELSNNELLQLASSLGLLLTHKYLRRNLVLRLIRERLEQIESEHSSPPPLERPAIIMENVTKRFGSTIAVDNLTLIVNPGEIVGLVGPNGAGKTTTLRMLTGIIRPTTGVIKINGYDIKRETIPAKQIIGYIPERPTCYENLRVREYLTFVARVYGVPKHEAILRIGKYARLLQLDEYLNAFVGTLSKGNLQRTLLAGIFVRPPPFVLTFDEPIYGLDPKGAWSLKQLLRELRDKGSAILISTHILEVAERLCDRFLIMNAGHIVGSGTIDELKNQCPGASTLEEIFLTLTGGLPRGR